MVGLQLGHDSMEYVVAHTLSTGAAISTDVSCCGMNTLLRRSRGCGHPAAGTQ
jgi:hypothetical protein